MPLQQIFNASLLPSFLGGTLEDKDLPLVDRRKIVSEARKDEIRTLGEEETFLKSFS